MGSVDRVQKILLKNFLKDDVKYYVTLFDLQLFIMYPLYKIHCTVSRHGFYLHWFIVHLELAGQLPVSMNKVLLEHSYTY